MKSSRIDGKDKIFFFFKLSSIDKRRVLAPLTNKNVLENKRRILFNFSLSCKLKREVFSQEV